MSPISIGLVPMTSTDDWEVNLKSCLEQLSFFETRSVDLVGFPENSLYFNFSTSLKLEEALTLDHKLWLPLRDWARAHNTYLHMGGIPLIEGGQVYNSTVLIRPDGSVDPVYNKIHLFDVKVGEKEIMESKSFCAGDQLKTIDILGWKMGMSICYDIRFAEMFVEYHKQEVDLIFTPAAFLVPTGRAHWETLLRARAIESQCYIVSAAQVGEHESTKYPGKKRQTWGQALVAGPWGDILSKGPSFDEPHMAMEPFIVELDPGPIVKTRQQIPQLSHRKLKPI